MSSASGTQTETPLPVKPKIGKLMPSGKGFEAVVGGKPLRNWTGPDPNTPRLYSASHCRFADLDKAGKQEALRLNFTFKYKKGDDVYDFGSRLSQHFDRFGLDSIMHAYSPTDPTDVVSVLTSFDELELKQVEKEITNGWRPSWDEYDERNDSDARTILLNSVDNVTNRYLTSMDPNKTLPAAVLFLHIVKRGQVALTADLYSAKRKTLDGLTANDFEGENVQKYVDTARPIVQELIRANDFPTRRRSSS